MARRPKMVSGLSPVPWPVHGWEYDVQLLDYAAEDGWSDTLDELGAEGWRVVALIHDEDPAAKDRWVRVVLERPRAQPKKAESAPPRVEDEGAEEGDD